MHKKIHSVNQRLKYVFIWIHISIIYYSWLFYSKENIDLNIFLPTNCQINETLTKQIPCSINKSSKINKLCKKTFYGIIYANNSFTYFDKLPTWFFPIDAENLSKTPMNIRCYHSRLHQTNIRWSKPDPKGFIQLILFSLIALCLIVIHCLHE